MSNDTFEVRCPNCGSQQVIPRVPAGDRVRCAECGAEFEVPAGSPAAPDGPRPPHLAAPLSPEMTGPVPPHLLQPPTSAPGEPTRGVDSGPTDSPSAYQPAGTTIASGPGSSSTWKIVVLVVFVVALITFALVAILGPWLQRNVAPEEAGNDDRSAVQANAATAGEDVEWVNASRKSLKKSGVTVDVERVEFGEVRGRDERGRVIVSDDASFLLIYLEVQNDAGYPLEYRSWYGNSFEVGGTSRVATLTDDQGRAYQMMTFSDVRTVRGHLPQDTLDAGDRLQDVIIYDIPKEVDRSSVQLLRLELPAAAFGQSGAYYFEIPVSMIAGEW